MVGGREHARTGWFFYFRGRYSDSPQTLGCGVIETLRNFGATTVLLRHR